MKEKEAYYSPGQTPASCVYDAALLLSMADDAVALDRDSEFYKVLHALNNSAWASLPPVVTMDFREPEKMQRERFPDAG